MLKKIDPNDMADFTEPFIDEVSKQLLQKFAGEAMPELLEDAPLIKYGVFVGKLFGVAKNYHRMKMLSAFLTGLRNGTKSMEEFEALSEDDRNSLRGLVIAQLDLLTDDRQGEAVGLAVDAHLQGDIDKLTLRGILAELKNINPLLYYSKMPRLEKSYKVMNSYRIEGSLALLPNAFYSNITEPIKQKGQIFQLGTNKHIATHLGEAFFLHILEPLSLKYVDG